MTSLWSSRPPHIVSMLFFTYIFVFLVILFCLFCLSLSLSFIYSFLLLYCSTANKVEYIVYELLRLYMSASGVFDILALYKLDYYYYYYYYKIFASKSVKNKNLYLTNVIRYFTALLIDVYRCCGDKQTIFVRFHEWPLDNGV